MALFSLSHIGEKDEGKEAKENHFSSQPAKQPTRRYPTNPEALGVVKSHSFIDTIHKHTHLSTLLTHTSTVCVTTNLIHTRMTFRERTHILKGSLSLLFIFCYKHTLMCEVEVEETC